MTKYILNSGGLRNQPELAKKFFSEAVEGLRKNPRVLACYFAEPQEIWRQKFKEQKENIFKLFPEGVNPIFTMALLEAFVEQIKDTDILYMHGGDNYLVQSCLKKFNIAKIWEGKVVATNSASSVALSKYAWACDYRKCVEGLCILPIKFFPHFKSDYGASDSRGPIDWDKALEELKSYKEDLPVYALREGEYVVFNK